MRRTLDIQRSYSSTSMRKDEDVAVIEPRKGKREEALPPVAFFVFTPLDLEVFLRGFPHPPVRSHRIYLTDVYKGILNGAPAAVAGPMLGAPQAILVLEKMIALGVKSVVAVGWCGTIQPHVRIGDVVLPIAAVSEEGTSRHYPIPASDPGPSRQLLDPVKHALISAGMTVHEGLVWSTDAPFRETVGNVLKYQEEGVLAVDMEASALFTVARYRGVHMAVAMVVSDDLSTLKWIHGFRDERFKDARKQLIALTLETVGSLSLPLSS